MSSIMSSRNFKKFQGIQYSTTLPTFDPYLTIDVVCPANVITLAFSFIHLDGTITCRVEDGGTLRII